jgi:hypothetical protein
MTTEVVLGISLDPDTREYKVIQKVNGKVSEPRTYYTDSDLDAALTLATEFQDLRSKKNMQVSVANNELTRKLLSKVFKDKENQIQDILNPRDNSASRDLLAGRSDVFSICQVV